MMHDSYIPEILKFCIVALAIDLWIMVTFCSHFRLCGPIDLSSGWLQLDVLMHAKRRKVHADDNEAVVLLTNCTSFISIF